MSTVTYNLAGDFFMVVGRSEGIFRLSEGSGTLEKAASTHQKRSHVRLPKAQVILKVSETQRGGGGRRNAKRGMRPVPQQRGCAMGVRDNMSRCGCGCVVRTVDMTYHRITTPTGDTGYTRAYRPTRPTDTNPGRTTTGNVRERLRGYDKTTTVHVGLCPACTHRTWKLSRVGTINARVVDYATYADAVAGI